MGNDLISQRELARRLNISEKAVRDSIKRGLISKGVIYPDGNGRPRIDYLIAYNEAVANNVGKNSRISRVLSDINALSIAINKATEETTLRLSKLQKRADQLHLAIPKEAVKLISYNIIKPII